MTGNENNNVDQLPSSISGQVAVKTQCRPRLGAQRKACVPQHAPRSLFPLPQLLLRLDEHPCWSSSRKGCWRAIEVSADVSSLMSSVEDCETPPTARTHAHVTIC